MNNRRGSWALCIFVILAALLLTFALTVRGQSPTVRLKPDTTGVSYTTWSDYGSANSMQ